MTFFQLARRSVWRKPMRTVLLMVCVATTFLIYGLTASFLNGAQGAASSSSDILGVMNAAGMAQGLPLAYEKRIAADADVAAVTYTSRLRAYAETERNTVTISAADPVALAAVNGAELGLTPDLLVAVGQARDRVLVGRALAQAQGWTVGQRIAVTTFNRFRADAERTWRFEIAGIFDGKTANTDTYFIIAQYDYVNAARGQGKDTADVFVVRPVAGAASEALAARLDALFANSAAPTRTQSEKQFLEAFLRQYADVGLIVNLVVGASFVTLLMIVINTMVFAVRERFFEIGVLKTLGFSRGRIVSLILTETLFVFVVGGLGGLALTQLVTVFASAALGLVLSPWIALKMVGLILGLALLTGLLPAINTMRIPVTAAFRTR